MIVFVCLIVVIFCISVVSRCWHKVCVSANCHRLYWYNFQMLNQTSFRLSMCYLERHCRFGWSNVISSDTWYYLVSARRLLHYCIASQSLSRSLSLALTLSPPRAIEPRKGDKISKKILEELKELEKERMKLWEEHIEEEGEEKKNNKRVEEEKGGDHDDVGGESSSYTTTETGYLRPTYDVFSRVYVVSWKMLVFVRTVARTTLARIYIKDP